jgi:plasmid stabilization system protein ParE
MRLAYHPLVQRDVSGILRHYDQISPRLGDEFWAELMRLIELVSQKPERFHFADRGLRRANMRRFPYHLLFRQSPGGIRVIVVRHDRRHPTYGTRRK